MKTVIEENAALRNDILTFLELPEFCDRFYYVFENREKILCLKDQNNLYQNEEDYHLGIITRKPDKQITLLFPKIKYVLIANFHYNDHDRLGRKLALFRALARIPYSLDGQPSPFTIMAMREEYSHFPELRKYQDFKPANY